MVIESIASSFTLMGEGQDGDDPKAEFSCYIFTDKNFMLGGLPLIFPLPYYTVML